MGDRFFAVGGWPPNTLAVNEAFDAVARTWSARAAVPTGRSGHGAAVVRGCLYVFGGEGNAARPDGVFPQDEAYDAAQQFLGDPRPHAHAAPRHRRSRGRRPHLHSRAVRPCRFGATAAHQVYTVPTGKSCE